ncbi:hypothetical protein ACTGYZ_11905, partial [Streptococcus suis]
IVGIRTYGAAMASSYNSRPISPQVMVDGDRFKLVGDRTLPSDFPTRPMHQFQTADRALNEVVTRAA